MQIWFIVSWKIFYPVKLNDASINVRGNIFLKPKFNFLNLLVYPKKNVISFVYAIQKQIF